jgi:hypothetical protein
MRPRSFLEEHALCYPLIVTVFLVMRIATRLLGTGTYRIRHGRRDGLTWCSRLAVEGSGEVVIRLQFLMVSAMGPGLTWI